MKDFKRLLCLILVAIMLIPSWTPVHAENEVSMNFEYEGYIPGSSYVWYGSREIGEIATNGGKDFSAENTYDESGAITKTTFKKKVQGDVPLKQPHFILYQLPGIETKITITVGGVSQEVPSIPETTGAPIENVDMNFQVGSVPFNLNVHAGNKYDYPINFVTIQYQKDVDYTYTEDINIKIVSTVKDIEKVKNFNIAAIDWYVKENRWNTFILDQEQKAGYEKIKKAFEGAKTAEDIYQARIDLQKYIYEDKKRIDAEVKPLEERVSNKLWTTDEDGNLLIDETIVTSLFDEMGEFEYLATEENKTWQKFVERLTNIELKVDIELKKAELKKKLDTKVGGEDVFTQDQKDAMIAQIDDVTTYDQEAKDKLALIEKEIDTQIKAKELKEAKDKAKEDIKDLNLTEDEKKEAEKAIDDAKTKEEVDKAVEDAKEKSAANDAKDKELKEAKDKAKEEIKDLNLIDDEKKAADEAIDNAKTKDEVDKAVKDAKEKSAANDEKDKELKEAKDKAKEDIKDLNLTEDEKKEAEKAIDDAKTKEEVDKAVEDAKEKSAANDEKDKAPTEEEKKEAKDIIDKLPNLSEDEKKEAKDKVDNAQTKEDVKKAVEEAEAKDAEKGKTPTEEEKKEAKDIIDKLPNLSEDEKKEAKDKVDKAQTKEDVKKAVEEAKAKDAEKGKVPTPIPTPVPEIDFNRFYFTLPYARSTEVKKTNKYTVDTIIKIGSNKITRVVNGVPVETEMDVAAFIDNDRTYIPLRFVGESMGFEVTWDEANRTAILKNKDKEVKIAVDSNVFYVNGERFESDVKPMIKNSRTMIPVGNFARAIGLQDGKDIFWDGASREVTIKQVMEY